MPSDLQVIAIGAGVAVALGAGYYLYTHRGTKPGGSQGGTLALTVVGSSTSSTGITATNTSKLGWSVTGLPQTAIGSEIQFVFGTTSNPSSGFVVVDTATATADNLGNVNADGTYTLTPGGNDAQGDSFYALTYNTAANSDSGYSNAVKVTINNNGTAPPSEITLSLSPSTAPPGGSISWQASGLTDGGPFIFALASSPTDLTASSTGTYSGSFSTTGLSPGAYTVEVLDSTTSMTATQTLTIT